VSKVAVHLQLNAAYTQRRACDMARLGRHSICLCHGGLASSGRFHMLDYRPSNRRRAAAAPGYLERTIPLAGTTVQDALVWSHTGIQETGPHHRASRLSSPRRRSIKVFPLLTPYFTISSTTLWRTEISRGHGAAQRSVRTTRR